MNGLALITQALEEILDEGGEQNFLIINLGRDYYIQFAGQKGGDKLHCEAVSNNFLSDEIKLSESQIAALQAMGWENPSYEMSNFTLTLPAIYIADRDQLLSLIQRTADIYGVHIDEVGEDDLSVNLE